MAGFDEGNIFYANSVVGNDSEIGSLSHNVLIKNKFNRFIKNYKSKGFEHHYRDMLLKCHKLKTYFIKIQIDDLNQFDSSLANELIEKPDELILILEEVVNEVLNEIAAAENEKPKHVQVLLGWNSTPKSLRNVKSEEISKLVKLSGIVITSSDIRSKARKLTLQCRGCRQYLPNIAVKAGFNSYALPRKCTASATNARLGVGANQTACPLDPYFIVPDMCRCVDYQTLKLQEAPEHVPHGEMPRHSQLYLEGHLCERAVPGNRVTVIGVLSIQNVQSKKRDETASDQGVSSSYIRALGIEIENTGSARSAVSGLSLTEEEEREFREFAQNGVVNVYDVIVRSIAPNIFGCEDIKRAMACLLIGGSRKRLSDELTKRGDINVLLLGDPGTAKSQLLKFVSEVAPISVYTSGKGSSAAGLTASVMRDSKTRKFVMEGGAMVLADGGVVCIDEFDKMREDDRVAIHEAMEQQTISIAKAGITTMLNSRCSVLAAANSVYGRWEEGKGADNIDLMPTILSRFDMIFIVRDVHDETRDYRIASQTTAMHRKMGANHPTLLANTVVEDDETSLGAITADKGIMSLLKLKKYIAFCRSSCGPRLTETASNRLMTQYVLMRSGRTDEERESTKKGTIPITIRQLESMARIAESLAKMRLAPYADERDVEEAIRLFKASTMEAATNGHLEGADELNNREDHDMIIKLETTLKRRMVIGSQVSEDTIVKDFLNQGFPERATKKVLSVMIRRGEIQPRMQKRMLLRVM